MHLYLILVIVNFYVLELILVRITYLYYVTVLFISGILYL